MKKILFIAVLAAFSFTATAQTSFGALGGLSILSPDFEGVDADSETGFHIGAFAEIEISEKFDVQPEVTYTSASDISLININAIAKYNVSEDFNVQLGPQVGFVGGDFGDLLDDIEDTTKLNLQLAVGLGYNITEEIFAQARYGFQLNDHFTGDGDGEIKINTISVGVGYRF